MLVRYELVSCFRQITTGYHIDSKSMNTDGSEKLTIIDIILISTLTFPFRVVGGDFSLKENKEIIGWTVRKF